jgi:hypothetical protein
MNNAVKDLFEELALPRDHRNPGRVPILTEQSDNMTTETNCPAQATKRWRATKPL